MESNLYFVSDQFKNDIINVVRNEFPNLNIAQRDILGNYLVSIVDNIGTKFYVKGDKSAMVNQFLQNNNQDLIGILNLLLPYIDEGVKSKKDIKNLNEVYTLRETNKDVNLIEPKYSYSNIQYGRCKRDNGEAKEIPFNVSHLKHNYIILRETIQIVSNKLYVNWIDIRPIPFYSLQERGYKEKAFKSFSPLEALYNEMKEGNPFYNPLSESDEGRSSKSMYIGDIYNTITNYFYHDIKQVKWLIYDVFQDRVIKQYIHILDELFPMKTIYMGLNYEQMSTEDKNKFKSSWEQFISNTKSGSISGNFQKDDYERLLIVIGKFFDAIHRNNKRIKNDGYKPIKLESLTEDIVIDVEDDEIPSYNDVDKETVLNAISTTPIKYLYNYFNSAISGLKSSWQGYYFFTKDFKLKERVMLDEDSEITFKNLYNYGKNLCTYEDVEKGERVLKDHTKFWRGLTTFDKNRIYNNLTKNQNWYNIRGNIKRLYKGRGESVNRLMNIKRVYFKENICLLVFNCLTCNGILTEFAPSPKITSNDFLPDDFVEKSKYIINQLDKNVFSNTVYQKCHYFVTNKPYEDHIMYYEKNKQTKETNYVEQLRKTDGINMGAWYTTYGMNWISQINFFHRYLNNRVFYVTGSTGVGKSSQVPKLLMYALKMVDYNPKGSVICSQPRIPPTEKNTKTISTQMGIPIYAYNGSLDENLDTENFNIMFQHSKDKHSVRGDFLSLKMVTDGLLLSEVKKNPLLKDGFSDKDGIFRFSPTNKNVYDIVIVDEAHEHNTNMDIILTIMRNHLYYNNSLRLVIVSATMDEDEPVYRRYYRNINDNKLYPFNRSLEENKLDRINVDRRLHISPPGATTRHNIDEKYDPKFETKEDDIVLRIASQPGGLGGDILLFRPGVAEISRSVKYLNKNLPPNFIALPYYSDMPKSKKEFIEELNNKNKGRLTHPRDVQYDIEVDESTLNLVPEKTYDRVVIVATNIAEASITINTLRYVVDTGNQKAGKFDYKVRDSTMELVNISESSRVQRRGRVGRVAPGSVVYAYHEEKLKGVKKTFNISTSDLSDTFFDLLRSENDELVYGSEYDPNTTDKGLQLKSGAETMILKQYCYRGRFINYRGQDDQYDYNNNQPPPPLYTNGFSSDTISDFTGTFYIVHPEELEITRNILGTIVSKSNNNPDIEVEDSRIKRSNKIDTFWSILVEMILVYHYEGEYYKTEFGTRIIDMKRQFIEEPLKDILAMAYSRIYNTFDSVIKVLTLCKAINYSPNGLAYSYMVGNKVRSDIQRLKEIYKDNRSELFSYERIANMIDEYVSRSVDIPSEIDELKGRKDILNKVLSAKLAYLRNRATGNFRGLDKKLVKKLISLDFQKKISYSTDIDEEELKEFFKEDLFIDSLYIFFEEKKPIFKEWCKSNHFQYKKVRSYIKSYYDKKNKLEKYEKNLDEIDRPFEPNLNWFSEKIKLPGVTNNPKENMIRTFIHSHGSNLLRRVTKYQYVLCINPSVDSVYDIPKINPKVPIRDTLMNEERLDNYIICLNKNSLRQSIGVVSNVNPITLQKILPFVFSPNCFTYDKYPTDVYISTANQLVVDPEKSSRMDTLIGKFTTVVKNIKVELLGYFTYAPYTTISLYDGSDKYKSSVKKYLSELKTQRGGYHIVKQYRRKNIRITPFVLELVDSNFI